MQMACILEKHMGVINLNLQGIQPWIVVLEAPFKLTRSVKWGCPCWLTPQQLHESLGLLKCPSVDDERVQSKVQP